MKFKTIIMGAVASTLMTSLTHEVLAQQLPTRLQQIQQLKWQQVAPGVWKTIIGKADQVNYMSLRRRSVQIDGLKSLPLANFPLDLTKIAGTAGANKAFVRLPMADDEKIYGMGLQFKGVRRDHKRYRMEMSWYHGGNEKTHAPVPFYVSSKGYGVLINSISNVEFFFNNTYRPDSDKLPVKRDRTTDRKWTHKAQGKYVEASVNGDGLEVIVFAGPTLMNVVQRYNLYSGGGVLPPKWGLGFWDRAHTKHSQDFITNAIKEYKTHKMPLSVMGVEPGWQTKTYPSTLAWDNSRFPDPKKFVTSLKNQGIYVNLWEHPYLHPESPLYKQIEPLSASHLVYQGIVPDLTLAKTRKVFQDYHQKIHLDIGIAGYKLDEVDERFPGHVFFPGGLNGEQYSNIQGLLYQKTMVEMYDRQNLRTYGLVRASNAGAASSPFVLYSDHYNHEDFIAALCNSSLSGILWTPEIRSAGNEREWVRRMQAVCMSPLAMLNAWSSGKKPWSFKKVENEIRTAINLRMSLLPYIYTTFAQYRFTGQPPVRSMLLNYNIENADQFMLGDSLLVAPIIWGKHKNDTREVILPKGKWYDFYTGKYVGNDQKIKVTVSLDKMPLFVKNGGIIPMINPVMNPDQIKENTKLTLRHYGDVPSEFMLYDDDGKTFNYQNKEFSITRFSVVKDEYNNKLVGKITGKYGSYKPFYGDVKWLFMTK
ncbi:TIM-barrel domain-containing protein [Lentisphaerota bacterium WC36G]|nr:DUF5110 domain-containing protein [Lentisphaerae bacterium WC36]